MKKLTVLLAASILLLSACGQSERPEKLEWHDRGISTILPVPDADYGSIGLELEDSFSAYLSRCTLDDYTSYVNDCTDAGFTVDSEDQGDDYQAYNPDGFELQVSYRDYSEEIFIQLNAPRFEPHETYTWPSIGFSTMLPKPESDIGSISIDSSMQFLAYIGETSMEDYNRYVDNCIDSGFDVDYNRSDDVFSADNANGDSLRVEYEGFQTMSISIYAADEETDSTADHTTDTPEPGATSETEPEPSTSEDSSTPDDSEIRPEFKETMDSYEAFFDTYVSFMTEYANTDDPSAMLIDYLAYLEEYTEMMEQLDAIDETELTTAELLYYSEVMSRISQKLLTVD